MFGKTASAKSEEATALLAGAGENSSTGTGTGTEDSIDDLKKELYDAKEQIKVEKVAKRKLYSGLVKLGAEIKRLKKENEPMKAALQYEQETWYDGGMWRPPTVLPSVQNKIKGSPSQTTITSSKASKQAVSLSDLFFDIVIITAFTRVGTAIAPNGLRFTTCSYFAVFWTIWSKEASYSTRFDTTDLSAKIISLLTCFAVLFGSLSATDPSQSTFNSVNATRIMMVALFVSSLQCLQYIRVYYWYKDANIGTVEEHVRFYASYNIIMNGLEIGTWTTGILLPITIQFRWLFFVFGILFSLRVPRSFLANDFHGACSKRAVLFILLLGFLLQSIVVVASPFFTYDSPTAEQYCFLGGACFVLFCIKLMYVDDNVSTQAEDHALLVNRWAGFFFYIGQFALLLSTTTLGAGLNLLTQSYLARTAALPNNAKHLTCGGFAAVVVSMAFIKSMHLRRVPININQRMMFIIAYGVQVLVFLAVVYLLVSMCLTTDETSYLSLLMRNEIEMMGVLSGFALCLVVTQWLDEAVELSLYGGSDGIGDTSQYLTQPFGIWFCLRPEIPMEEADVAAEDFGMADRRLSSLSPLLGASIANMRMSYATLNYDAIAEDTAAQNNA